MEREMAMDRRMISSEMKKVTKTKRYILKGLSSGRDHLLIMNTNTINNIMKTTNTNNNSNTITIPIGKNYTVG